MSKIVEWSANFDVDTLDKLLVRAIARSNGGISEYHRRSIVELTRSMKEGEEKPVSFVIRFNGQSPTFGLMIHMDDADAPDVRFFSSPDVIEMMKAEHEELCDELGI